MQASCSFHRQRTADVSNIQITHADTANFGEQPAAGSGPLPLKAPFAGNHLAHRRFLSAQDTELRDNMILLVGCLNSGDGGGSPANPVDVAVQCCVEPILPVDVPV